jgi:hypothetical protein
MKESSLQAQLENRTRDFALAPEQGSAGVDVSRDEMDRLSREQAQAAAVEAQISALFASLNGKIKENRLDDAAEIIKTMRSFLNTPAFQSLRSIQARKELYTQSINSFETMIEEARKNQAALASGILPTDEEVEKIVADIWEKNDKLEKDIAERDRRIAAFNSGGGNTTRVSELESTISARDNRIRSLETTNNTQRQTIDDQRRTINAIQDVIKGRDIIRMGEAEMERRLQSIQEALE